MKTKLTKQEYNCVLAICILAQRKQIEVVQMEQELHEILGIEDNYSHLSDSIYDTEKLFDKAIYHRCLKNMGIEKP